jgi:hypothetical protein
MREIIVRPKDGDDIRCEFDRFLSTARSRGWNELKILFGFAWGNYAYENDWIEEVVSPDGLETRVRELEEKGDGSIGEDDLFVTVLAIGIQHTFCHENDIHIEGPHDDPYIDEEAGRYQSLGWELHDRTKEANKPS